MPQKLKKFVAAALLVVYLFNIGGQLALHQYFTYLSDKIFKEQTSMGRYNINDLTEVKIPANMPGITNWVNYENIAGQIKFGDCCYNYVKMKITKTAVYLMCVPNYETTRLSDQNILCAKNVKNIPVSPKEHVPFGKTTLLGNFNIEFTLFTFSSPYKSPVLTVVQFCQQLIHHSPDIPEQPPKFC
jgi:hypothetical protein